MSEQQYQPGDRVNGYVLGSDGQWHQEQVVQWDVPAPVPHRAEKPSPWKRVGIASAILLGALVVVSGLSNALTGESPGGNPAPAVTVTTTPATPTPEVVTPTPVEQTHSVGWTFLGKAWQQMSPSSRQSICSLGANTAGGYFWRKMQGTAADGYGLTRAEVIQFFDEHCPRYYN